MQQVMTIQEQVYQFLKEDICSGVFRPGQRLQEVSIANQYKVSRSPVREALRRRTVWWRRSPTRASL